MTSQWKTAKRISARYLVPLAALIGAFALDGATLETRGLVVRAVPRWFLHSLAHGGDFVTVAAVVVVLFICGLAARCPRFIRAAVVLASALTATAFVVLSLKWLASRGPHGVFHGFGAAENGIMFPSGHTAMAFAACTVLGLVWPKARWPACAVALGVAISRVVLIHFLSDVVAGALIGAAVGQGVAHWWAAQGFLELEAGLPSEAEREPDRP
jgi:membrane-associated phospholipid phosphatase